MVKVFHLSRAGGAKMLFDVGLHTDAFGAELFSAAPKASGSPRAREPMYVWCAHVYCFALRCLFFSLLNNQNLRLPCHVAQVWMWCLVVGFGSWIAGNGIINGMLVFEWS